MVVSLTARQREKDTMTHLSYVSAIVEDIRFGTTATRDRKTERYGAVAELVILQDHFKTACQLYRQAIDGERNRESVVDHLNHYAARAEKHRPDDYRVRGMRCMAAKLQATSPRR